MVHFKSTATLFSCNSGSIGLSQLKFRKYVDNLIFLLVLLLKGAKRSSKVLPCPFAVTLELLVLQYFFWVPWNSIGFLRVPQVSYGPFVFLRVA